MEVVYIPTREQSRVSRQLFSMIVPVPGSQ